MPRKLNVLRRSWKKLVALAAQEREQLDNLIVAAKTRLDTIETWKDIAVTKFTILEERLDTIEDWKVIGIAKFVELEERIETLESQVSQAQNKFQQIDDTLATIADTLVEYETRITALEP